MFYFAIFATLNNLTMKNIYTVLLLTVAFNFGTAQNYEWLHTAGGSSDGWDLVSAIDNDDNMIYGGTFTTDTMFIGNDTLINDLWMADPASFMVKINNSGTILWTKMLADGEFVYIDGIDTDAAGNIYATGSWSNGEMGAMDFGNGVQAYSYDAPSLYIVKFDPNGNALWAHGSTYIQQWTGHQCEGKEIIVDAVGNSYVAIEMSGDSVVIGNDTIVNTNFGAGYDELFILKLAPNGNISKGYLTGMDTRDDVNLGFTPLGNVLLATQYANSSISVVGTTLTNPNPGTKHGALIKFNQNLIPIWGKTFGCTDDDEFTDVAVDNLGNIFVTGGIMGPGSQITFGGTTVTNNSFVQGVILKFDFSGNELGIITTTSPSGFETTYFTDIDIINHNEMYVTCLYDTAVQLGSSNLPDPAHFGGFVARIDSTGDALWMYNPAGLAPLQTDTVIIKALQHDQAGNLHLGGWYNASDIDFNGLSANNTMTGPYDVFFTKLSNQCNLSLSFSITNSSCGTNSGAAVAQVTGGSGNYNYQWTSGDSIATASSLTAGMYQVSITDLSTGCDISGVAMVSDDGGAIINIVGVGTNDVTCPGGNDGQVLINLVGGQAPRTITWSTGDTTLLIDNLTAGPYDVTVEDGNGCVTTQSITVTEPDAFDLSYTTTDASCGVSDGTATVHVEGGTTPYTHQWSSGAGTDTIATGLSVGDYLFGTTDANGCIDTILVMINEANGPIITIDSVLTASCLNGNGGSVYISVSGQSGPYTYQWSNGGGTNEDLVGVAPGNYAVMVTAGNGCSSMTSGPVTEELPEIQEVCIVTVDTTSGYNLVVWEKPVVGHISHYKIYQEQTQAGVFNLVGSVLYIDSSQFVDSLANPMVRSYRYKISAVDTCGVESELSWNHKTIHMVKSSFAGDNYLSWDNYEGFTYPSFLVWKYTDQTGWANIATLPSNLNSYTDLAPTGTNIDYFIEAVPSDGCTSTKAQDHNTTRSNRQTILSGTNIEEFEKIYVNLFPNPTKNQFQIQLSNGTVNNWSYEVYDISGKSILRQRKLSNNNHTIDLSDTESGIYLVRIQMGNKMVFRKVVKQ